MLIFLICQIGLGQSYCGYNDLYNPLIKESNFNIYLNQQLDDIQIMAKKIKKSSSNRMFDDIPIVVHIIHEGESVGSGNNILYQDVVDAKDRLNADFSSAGIQFCLALRDEQGNQLTEPGVVRVDASSNADYVANGVSLGGQTEYDIKALGPQFDSYLYFNIWVVKNIVGANSNGQIQGVGTFPNTVGPDRDGVMMRHSIFNLSTNRVLTHEVGHYLGLFHTFQGDDADYDGVADQCPSISGDFPDSDEISDTQPHMRSPSLTCPSGTNSCPGGGLLEDISNNHMDYSSETCRVEFTTEQIAHMVATVMEKRFGLTISLGCEAVVCDPVFAVDFTVNPEFPVAPDDLGNNAEPGVFTASQSGTHEWYVDGVLMGSGTTYTHNFSEPGNYTICLFTEDMNNCIIQNCKNILVFDAGLCFDPILEPCELVLNGDFSQVNEDALYYGGFSDPDKPEATYHFFPGTFMHLGVICNWTNYIPEGIGSNPSWNRFSDGEAFISIAFIESDPFPLAESFGTVDELELIDGMEYELSFEYLVDGNFSNFYFALSDELGVMDDSFTKIFNSGPLNMNSQSPPSINDVFIQSGSIPFTYSATDGKFLYLSADIFNDGSSGAERIFIKNVSVKGCEFCTADPFFTYDNKCGEFSFYGVDENSSSNGIVTWRINGVTAPQSIDMYDFDFSFPYEGDFDVCMDISCPNGITESYCESVFAGGSFTIGGGGGQIACEICQNPETVYIDAQRCGDTSNEYLVEAFPISVPKGFRPCLGDFELTLGYGGTVQTNDYYVDESDPAEDVIYVSFSYESDGSNPTLGGLLGVCNPEGTESLCYQFFIDDILTCDQCSDDQSIVTNMAVQCTDDDISDGVIEYVGSFTIKTSPNSQPCGSISPSAGLSIQSVVPTSSSNIFWDVSFSLSTNQLGPFNTSVSLCFIDGNGDKICFDVIISVSDPCIPEEDCLVEILLDKLKCGKVKGKYVVYTFSALTEIESLFEEGYVFCDTDPVSGDNVTNSAPIGNIGNPIVATEGINSYLFGAELTMKCDQVVGGGLTTIYLNLCNAEGLEECVAITVRLECPYCEYSQIDAKRSIADNEHLIYPIPAREAIRVESPESNQATRYAIYAASGRVLSIGELLAGVNEISTEDLPSGIYYMKIEDGDNVTLKKFIIID